MEVVEDIQSRRPAFSPSIYATGQPDCSCPSLREEPSECKRIFLRKGPNPGAGSYTPVTSCGTASTFQPNSLTASKGAEYEQCTFIFLKSYMIEPLSITVNQERSPRRQFFVTKPDQGEASTPVQSQCSEGMSGVITMDGGLWSSPPTEGDATLFDEGLFLLSKQNQFKAHSSTVNAAHPLDQCQHCACIQRTVRDISCL